MQDWDVRAQRHPQLDESVDVQELREAYIEVSVMRTAARKTTAPRPLEREIQHNAIIRLESLRCVVRRRNTGAVRATHKGRERLVRFSEVGASDLTGYTPPPPGWPWWRPFDAECKRPEERPTLDQIEWLVRTNALTGAAFWFDSVEILERVMACLMQGGRVEYLTGRRRYGKAMGPTDEFDIIWPDRQEQS